MAGHIRQSAEAMAKEIIDLDTMDGPALIARWRSLTGRMPGAGLRGELLRWAIAFKLQEQALGGVSPASIRKLAIAAKAHRYGKNSNGKAEEGIAAISRSIKPGSRLIREWKGVVHVVVVGEDGYVWNGKKHSSLSTVAKAITGTHWNGWRFFGIDQKRGKQARQKQDASLVKAASQIKTTGQVKATGQSGAANRSGNPSQAGDQCQAKAASQAGAASQADVDTSAVTHRGRTQAPLNSASAPWQVSASPVFLFTPKPLFVPVPMSIPEPLSPPEPLSVPEVSHATI